MLLALRHRIRNDREDGFTLIELMVVVLIIAILIAIAIPTFLGAREKAQEKAAQSDLRNALTSAKTFYADNETYASATMTAAELEAIEPSLDFDAKASASKTVIGYLGTATDTVFVMQAGSDEWFCIADSTSTGTTYGNPANLAAITAASDCTGGW